MDIRTDLNPSQQEAVLYNDGPSLIIAGAGSGKTRVLTYKIAWLLEHGIRSNNILALTFTNKAAREMKERIRHLVGEEQARYLWMGTFHSICAKILRQEAEKLGYTRDFSIYDTADSQSVVKQLVRERQLDDKIYKPSTVFGRISAAKNMLMTPEAYAANQECTKRDRFDRLYDMAELYQLYTLRLKAANAMDFDDLLMQACRLFQENKETLKYYQDIFQYVLVDEYQDTNYAQYLLVKMLAEPQNKVCVVGDDAQSIYSFRGADIRNILGFQQDYKTSKLFKLERNYRSTQIIVQAANSLIKHNERQIFKDVYSENDKGDKISLRAYMSDRDEAQSVAQEIKRIKGDKLNGVAILYRTNAQSRGFENELRRLGIPYRIYGSTSFYQRKEIKDAICYLRLASNLRDNEALLRVINYPSRGIGDTTLRKIAECAVKQNISMFDVICNPVAAELPVSVTTMKRLKDFAQMMHRFCDLIETENAYTAADTMLRESGVMAAAQMDKTPEGQDRKENLDELLAGIHQFVDQRTEEGISFTPVQDFLSEVSLLTDQDEKLDDTTPRVTLMTVHAAKGLEFAEVYIVGMEENLFPSQFCTSPTEIEEERRLLYVAITRAMKHCHMSYARQRFKNGTVNFSSPSRFLNDIDGQFISLQEVRAAEKPAMPRAATSSLLDAKQNAKATASLRGTGKLVSLNSSKTKSDTAELTADSTGGLFPGDRVRHRVFGEGNILRIYRENDNDKIDIQFDGPGKKTLLMTFAKLERI